MGFDSNEEEHRYRDAAARGELRAHPQSRRDKPTAPVIAAVDLDALEGLNDLSGRLKVPRSLLVNIAVRDLIEKLKDAQFGHPL